MGGVSNSANPLPGFVPSEFYSSVGMRLWDVGSLSWVKATGSVAGVPSVSVTNFPATQAVSGTVSAVQSGAWSVAQSGTWTVAQGTPAAAANGWFARLTDGTNNVAVKAASTPAAATDVALVVSFAGANSATKIGDGTNNAAVKAASTAAAFTDPALTVDVRPGGALLTASAALADATANPTVGLQAVTNLVFNGSTHDRQRGMGVATTTGDTGAKTATGNGATQTNVGNKGLQLVLVLGTVSGTTPTLVLKVQGSVDGGTTWYDIPGAATASLTATGNFGITIFPGAAVTAGTTTTNTTAVASQPVPRTWRVVWTIGGTTPSFTITSITYNYLPY